MDNDALYEDVPVALDGHAEALTPTQAQEQEQEPLAGLSLDLTVRSGSISLPLYALQRLAPGVVLEVTGVVPGEATLCHGERVVAHGELVDVEGRLGLQITRMVFDR
ncbi:FliM/FliN family flagellar motor switch protein [Pseudomonas gingeri]|uniref:FliM/FliN family flagellar motor switch protein n=1 Tax=Pseudomonas gingeri TaxID=117681 RepID=A0A7Y8CIJ6_9PSED|nr:FliM/FliN family flagellar motor switch protein [Pseudomonas gingeri]NWA02063.1 FliM/FliN family flagellar motor switch protein [Pseudomonas gingeri]NWA18144.1 FliM/FliN family flagellar motor switch protein [Pseudomonas gingeri]NWA56275.1 FliM/FliN family flagellar motor switch protein [Pseudomonas gingeri]NWA98853.1 FliM/FliN family flagellar motor switch protein [Pseudomonas gingeri]NWB04828.1 FliM/FliN family flagellar motor switch protein [Pseudomonas gingeri]